jgi:hypothetical protein
MSRPNAIARAVEQLFPKADELWALACEIEEASRPTARELQDGAPPAIPIFGRHRTQEAVRKLIAYVKESR